MQCGNVTYGIKTSEIVLTRYRIEVKDAGKGIEMKGRKRTN